MGTECDSVNKDLQCLVNGVVGVLQRVRVEGAGEFGAEHRADVGHSRLLTLRGGGAPQGRCTDFGSGTR